jgi:hypothetical protein
VAFLKQLRASFTENARSADVELWSPRGLDEELDEAFETLYRDLWEKAKAELEQRGEAVDLVAYGLPLVLDEYDRKDNPERQHEWRIEQKEWAEASTLPRRLPIEDSGLDESRHAVWVFEGKVFLAEDTDLTPEDVRALLNQDRNRRRLALEKAHALQAMSQQMDKPRQRERLPQEVRVEVWQRDGGRCVECAGQANLEFDHIIPFAMGGSNTARNLQLLCGDCNRRKGMTLG